MNGILRLLLRPVWLVQGWLREPRLTLRVSAALGVLLTPFIAGSLVAMLDRLLGGLDPQGPLPVVLFALLAVGCLVAAGFQLWVSSRVLGEMTPVLWETAVSLSATRRTFGLLRVPTGMLLGLISLNILVLPVLVLGAVAWALLSLAGTMLWFAGTVLSFGALSKAVSREELNAGIGWAFEILTAPRQLFVFEDLVLTVMGPVGLAPLLLLVAVVAPTALTLVIYASRDALERVSSGE